MAAHTHTVPELPSDLVLRDGSRDFTGRVKGIDPLAAEDLATKRYVDGLATSSEVGTAIVGYASVSGAAGGANASRLQGLDVSADEPDDGDVLTWREASSEWGPEPLPSSVASDSEPLGIYEVPLNLFENCANGANEANFTYTSPVEAAGWRKWHTAVRTGAPAAAEARLLQAMTRAPGPFRAGTVLKARLRLYGDLAKTYTRVDLLAYRAHGKLGAPLEDICTTAVQALRGYEVGLESLVGAAIVGRSPYRDLEFTLDASRMESGEPFTLHFRVEYDNIGAGVADGAFFATMCSLVVGAYGWRVGVSSMIGSALVG